MKKLRFELRLRAQKWKRVNRVIMVLIAVVSIVLLVALFLPEIKEGRRLAAELDRQSAILAEQQSFHQKLKLERSFLNDPEYLEMIARDKIGGMKEGEEILKE